MRGVDILVLCAMSSNTVTVVPRGDRIICVIVDTFRYVDLLTVLMSRSFLLPPPSFLSI